LRYKRGRDRAATKGKQKTMRIPRKLILNFLTKSYLKQADSFPMTILNSRMKSMISDLWFCMAIIMPFFLLFMILFFLIQTFIYPEIEYFPTYLSVMLLPWLMLLFIILNKDIASGMSAGKRTFGFKIVDIQTKKEASQLQCMLRNVTMMLWPLEVLMIIINPKRRIGDFIAKTEVVETETCVIDTLIQDLDSIDKISPRLILISLLITVGLTSISFIATN